jgi:hypothetical protein
MGKQEKDKLVKVSQTFDCLEWNVFDFAKKLELDDASLNPHKDIKEILVTHEELVFTFGVRQQNGWKAIISEFFTVHDCEVLFKLNEDVYAHPPLNGDYRVFFLHGWLAQCKGHLVN